jgi:hypothetical protein
MAETPLKHLSQAGDGSKVEYGTDGIAYTELKEVRSIQYPRKTRGKVPGSTLNTPGRFKRKLKGWKDGDDLEVRVACTSAGLVIIDGLYEANGPDEYWKFTYPNAVDASSGGAWTFRGFIVSVNVGDVGTEVDELVECTLMIAVNSTPVFVPPP